MNREEKENPLPENNSCLEIDSMGTGGVLLSDEIEYLAVKHKMIVPFNPDNLKPAGYELSLGPRFAKSGELGELYPEPGNDKLTIPPFEIVIISTQETINLPRFIIARWNLRVKWVYEGLLWTGALQVDPGWVGPLFCPIYNLSSKPVAVQVGKPIVLMDFVKTTPFKKGQSKEYNRPPKRKGLEDYNWRLESALFTEAGQRITQVEKRVEETERKVTRTESIVGIVVTCLAVLFAAISIFITSSKSASVTLPIWVYVSVIFSLVAIAISLFARAKFERDRWFKILVIFYMIVSGVLLVLLVAKVL